MGHLYSLTFSNGKLYIGVSTRSADARFAEHRRCSATSTRGLVYRAWRRYGEPKLTVLAILDNGDLCRAEIEAIRTFGTLSPGGYNLSYGGEISPTLNPVVAAKVALAMTGKSPSPATRQKLSDAKYRLTTDTRAKMSASQKARAIREGMVSEVRNTPSGSRVGRKLSAETRAKLSAIHMGKKMPRDGVEKSAAAHRGKKQNPEVVARRAAKQRGLKRTPEQIAKMAAVWRGRKHSPESRAKISASRIALFAARKAKGDLSKDP